MEGHGTYRYLHSIAGAMEVDFYLYWQCFSLLGCNKTLEYFALNPVYHTDFEVKLSFLQRLSGFKHFT